MSPKFKPLKNKNNNKIEKLEPKIVLTNYNKEWYHHFKKICKLNIISHYSIKLGYIFIIYNYLH